MFHSTLSKSDIHLNQETFNWYNRMPNIFDEHEEIITRSRREAEEGLKVNNSFLRNQLIQIFSYAVIDLLLS